VAGGDIDAAATTAAHGGHSRHGLLSAAWRRAVVRQRFVVAPNQLVRERPFIAHNIEMTRRAYALDRIETHPFPAETGIEAVEPRTIRRH